MSIQWKGLYPIVLVAIVWGGHWSTKENPFLCDNQAVVSSIQLKWHISLQTYDDPSLQPLPAGSQTYFTVSVRHVPGVQNSIANFLSCFHTQEL